MLVWHKPPEKPAAQEQLKPFDASVQVPPFRQGLEAHSLIAVWQAGPEKPATQEQV
jgi:hypothetical protein